MGLLAILRSFYLVCGNLSVTYGHGGTSSNDGKLIPSHRGQEACLNGFKNSGMGLHNILHAKAVNDDLQVLNNTVPSNHLLSDTDNNRFTTKAEQFSSPPHKSRIRQSGRGKFQRERYKSVSETRKTAHMPQGVRKMRTASMQTRSMQTRSMSRLSALGEGRPDVK
jgi:hypothetical protein